MHCTSCGAAVPEGAKFCPGCGKAATAADRPTGAPGMSGKSKGCLFVGAAIAGLLVLASLAGGGGSGGSSSATTASTQPPLPITAADLARAYDDNEANAQEAYGNRPLLVSGTVAGVDLDFMDKPFVKLETDNRYMPAQAALTEESQPKASSLAKGQQITLRCENVSEVVGTPMLKDCSF